MRCALVVALILSTADITAVALAGEFSSPAGIDRDNVSTTIMAMSPCVLFISSHKSQILFTSTSPSSKLSGNGLTANLTSECSGYCCLSATMRLCVVVPPSRAKNSTTPPLTLFPCQSWLADTCHAISCTKNDLPTLDAP